MKPVVLICSHERMAMTCSNIDSLLAQSVVPTVVLVVSNDTERKFYRLKYGNKVIVGLHPNRPLGAKFQFGVRASRGGNPDLLIITGSDDILGKDFVKNACQLVTDGADFIGLKQWFIFHEEVLHLYQYMPIIPLGTRVYSRAMLEQLQWHLFDHKRDRLLDDYGFHEAKRSGLKIEIIEDVMAAGLNVVSIKGDWSMLNPYEKMKNHPNCKLLGSNYDPEAIL